MCFFWGTTYVSIRMALESFSPAMLVALRFLTSGGVLLIASKLMGARIPRGPELRRTAINGTLILGIGNGCLVVSELWIPSGLAALFISTSPFWMVGMEALVPGGQRLHAPTIGGMLIGFIGAVILGSRAVESGSGRAVLAAVLILQLGSIAWSLGSILQRRQTTATPPVVSGAVQQLAAGVVFIVPALMGPRTEHLEARGIWALLYLVVFGSIVGYSAYMYAMSRLPVAVVSLYSYVNPVVAVALGWLFYREPFGLREAIAMTIIFTGVAIVEANQRRPKA